MCREDEQIITLEEVTKTYQMGKVNVHALQGANLVIKRGDFAVILGPKSIRKNNAP